jgi:thiamine-phosphate pyrophosphorylase
VVTEAACRGPWEDAVARALASGAVDVVQLREKAPEDAEFLARARRLAALARPAGALLTLNDRAHLVREARADGVHLGEDDLPPVEARALLGPRPLIGVSTHDAAEVAAARGLGADYAGLGPCYATGTKRLSRPPRGPGLVAECARGADLPVFPIGGITAGNVADLVRAGATRVAVGAGILGTDDPLRAALRIRAALP